MHNMMKICLGFILFSFSASVDAAKATVTFYYETEFTKESDNNEVSYYRGRCMSEDKYRMLGYFYHRAHYTEEKCADLCDRNKFCKSFTVTALQWGKRGRVIYECFLHHKEGTPQRAPTTKLLGGNTFKCEHMLKKYLATKCTLKKPLSVAPSGPIGSPCISDATGGSDKSSNKPKDCGSDTSLIVLLVLVSVFTIFMIFLGVWFHIRRMNKMRTQALIEDSEHSGDAHSRTTIEHIYEQSE